MERFTVLLYLYVLVSGSCSATVIDGQPDYNLTWPEEYYFKAIKITLDSGVVEPYEVWYTAEQCRIDFNGGTVKRFMYYDPMMGQHVTSEVHPKTDFELNSFETCDLLPGDNTTNLYFLPSLKHFIYQGKKFFDNKLVEVWQSDTEMPYIIDKRILYVHQEEGEYSIPVRYQSIQFLKWNASVRSHFITNFYSFRTNVSADDLDVNNVPACQDALEKISRDPEKFHPELDSDVDKAFHSYRNLRGVNYKDNELEFRKQIIEENWRLIEDHNRKNLRYKMAINKFADCTPEEMVYYKGLRPSDPSSLGTVPFPFTEEDIEALKYELPEYYDMRQYGVISAVKDQGSCGSCWAFASTAAVEGAISRSNGGRNIDLSEQSLIDCAWSDNMGCDGGYFSGTFIHLLKNGIATEREYGPYLGQDGNCKLGNMTNIYKIKGFSKVPALNENALKAVLYHYGPVTAGIHASSNLMFYNNGVFYEEDCNKHQVNHAVTIVGYGSRNGTNYWIVKNSWGEDWGQDGYILMSSANNNCLIMSEAYYPIVY